MTRPPSVAERLDRAVDGMLAGHPPGLGVIASDQAALRPLVTVAADVRASLAPPPVAPRFEARVGARLAAAAEPRAPLAWALRTPGRRIVTGAVGSAAVGVGITAFAVWRHGRRTGTPAHRLLHR